jgi:hypothetical protein
MLAVEFTALTGAIVEGGGCVVSLMEGFPDF